jgi:hypothetical protein
MRRFRFSIRSLIGVIFICGFSLAALKESSEWWEKGTFSVTVLILLTSVLLAIHREGARGGFWLGFALFGSVYLGLALIPPIESRLVSSRALAVLHSKLPGQSPQSVVFTVTTSGSGSLSVQNGSLTLSGISSQAGGTVPSRVWSMVPSTLLVGAGGSEENFVKIGHCLVTLWLAWLGGLLSRRLARVSTPIEGPSQLAGSEP